MIKNNDYNKRKRLGYEIRPNNEEETNIWNIFIHKIVFSFIFSSRFPFSIYDESKSKKSKSTFPFTPSPIRLLQKKSNFYLKSYSTGNYNLEKIFRSTFGK